MNQNCHPIYAGIGGMNHCIIRRLVSKTTGEGRSGRDWNVLYWLSFWRRRRIVPCNLVHEGGKNFRLLVGCKGRNELRIALALQEVRLGRRQQIGLWS